MKTALELLGYPEIPGWGTPIFKLHDLELVAQRAREEAFEMAAARVVDAKAAHRNGGTRNAFDSVAATIRALKGEP